MNSWKKSCGNLRCCPDICWWTEENLICETGVLTVAPYLVMCFSDKVSFVSPAVLHN
jgi:hypothetical protein